jgi:two-component system, OmpR family, osmolarity sensor histidine kinase EnvZ
MISATRWLKDWLPHGLLGRSLLIIVTPLIVVQLVSTYIFYATHWDTVAKRLAEAVAGDIGAVIEIMRAQPDPEDRLLMLRIASSKLSLDVRFEAGGILPNIKQERPLGIMDAALHDSLKERVQRPFLVDGDSFEREILIKVQLSDGLLDIYVSRKRLFSSTTYIFVLWMVGTSMLLLGIATVFMRNQVRSVRKLAAAVDGFGKGRDIPPIKPEGAAEVRQAAQAFNLMRDRLKRQIQQRTEMLAGVSHDLRTPLTRMKLQLAMMNDDGVAELQEDVAEMGRMVEGYLAFVRGEGGEKTVSTSLGALLETVVAGYRREGREVDLHVEGDVVMPLRPHALSRALSNLIGNALRYGGHVWVRAGRRADSVEILVDDDGPGIPADKREVVFKAFLRLEGSRNVATGGIGLGMTIARDIVRGHGGDIVLEDSPLGGLRARVRLPL